MFTMEMPRHEAATAVRHVERAGREREPAAGRAPRGGEHGRTPLSSASSTSAAPSDAPHGAATDTVTTPRDISSAAQLPPCWCTFRH